MDFLTLNSTTFTLMQGTTAVPGAVTYSGISAFFTPASYLLPGTEYTGTITTGAKSLAGIPLADNFVWKFTTGVAPTVISTSPVNLTTGVVLNKIVSATFSVSMDYLSLNETTFTLKQGTNVITGTVTYNGTTASFTPANDLLPGLEYSAMITTGAKSLQGIAMVNNYVWKFNTGVVPKVISTDPPNLATGVILNKAVTVAFNIPLDPLTLTAANVTLKQGTNVIAGAITYSGTTLTFTPANAFTPNTVYTGTITTGVKSVSGMPMANDYIWNFNTGISPMVISTDPVNLATSVVLNKVVAATFSVPMDNLTLSATTFTLRQGNTAVPGAVTYSGTSAFFTPASNLLPGTEYTGTITTGAKSLAGIPLADNFVWKFTTGVAPTVISTSPVNLTTGVVLNKIVSATFSVSMDYLTLNGTTFTLKQGANVIAGAVTYNGTTASFTPANDLLPGLVYSAMITTGAKSLIGIPLAANYAWTFTTGLSPTVTSVSPLNLATGVALDKLVTATFSLPMDPLTINGTSFTLKDGLTTLTGTVSYNGTTASFNPAVNLLPGTIYTATLTTGAKSSTGIPLAANYIWTFTTGVAIAPTVTLTSPLNLATSVALNKVVTATFSLPMDPMTLNGTSFTLKDGLTTLTGTVSYNGTTASFTPSVNLIAGTTYTGTITTGAKSLLGIPLTANYVWTFTTVPAAIPKIILTDPIDKSIGVAINKTISATFDMPMDRTTLVSPATTFTLRQGATYIAGTVTYSSANAYFKPSVDLLYGTTYTARITTGARNVAGTPIARDSVWSFTTLPEVKPLFSSIFGSFGGNAGVTNQGIHTVINNGSIGTTAASTLITGFHDNTGDSYTETPLNIGNVKGRIYTDAPPPVIFAAGGPYGGNATTMAIAQAGLLAASNFYISISPANKPGGITLSNDELGGRTLAPGIYISGSSYNITSIDLTLDAQGDPNAVWIFQVPSALTVGTPSGARSIILTGGAQAKNVYWYVGTSAVINYAGGGTMVGTIIANSGVTLSSPGNSTNTTVQTVLNGRAISLVSAVTMVNTIINVP